YLWKRYYQVGNLQRSDDGTCQQETAHAPADAAHPWLRRTGRSVSPAEPSFPEVRPRAVPGSATLDGTMTQRPQASHVRATGQRMPASLAVVDTSMSTPSRRASARV